LPDLLSLSLLDLPAAGYALLIGVVVVAGLVRGFSGFGAALIFMPVASSLIDPRLAAGVFLFVDAIVALPLVVRGIGVCDWRTVWPAALGGVMLAPLGAWVLAGGDVLVLRWAISLLALALLGLMVSGWRYHGAPNWPISLGVGAGAGFMGGLAQIAGPPVIAYWMSGPAVAAIIRANIIVFFFFTGMASFFSYWANDIFSTETPGFVLMMLPAYGIALFTGAKLFRYASENIFRRIAFVLIGVAAFTSLPIFDGLFR